MFILRNMENFSRKLKFCPFKWPKRLDLESIVKLQDGQVGFIKRCVGVDRQQKFRCLRVFGGYKRHRFGRCYLTRFLRPLLKNIHSIYRLNSTPSFPAPLQYVPSCIPRLHNYSRFTCTLLQQHGGIIQYRSRLQYIVIILFIKTTDPRPRDR